LPIGEDVIKASYADFIFRNLVGFERGAPSRRGSLLFFFARAKTPK